MLPAHESLSFTLWGLEWSALLPELNRDLGLSVRLCTPKDLEQFAAAHWKNIYQFTDKDVAFRFRNGSAAKALFYERFADCFEFSERDKVIGIFIAHATDWETYYLRNATFLEDYQHRGIYQKFLAFILKHLQIHGVQRVTGDVAPAHLKHIHILNKLGFYITSLSNSERFGTQLHFCKFLDEEKRQVFINQFNLFREGRDAGVKVDH